MEGVLDLDDLWIDLKNGFEQVFSGQTISKQRFMQLYTWGFLFSVLCIKLNFQPYFYHSTVYNYCKFVNIDEVVLQGEMSVAHFVGGQLFSRVDLFLNKQVKIILDVSIWKYFFLFIQNFCKLGST